jgi:hypothetical protein
MGSTCSAWLRFATVPRAVTCSSLFVGSFLVSGRLSPNTTAPEVSPTGVMSTPRSGHTATLLHNGLVLVAGGMRRNGSIFGTADLYDPATGRFRPTRGSMTTPRVGHEATLLPDGRALLEGGWNADGTLASAELYDPVSTTFGATGSMASRRGDFTATLLPTGKVLVVGGEDQQALATAELYDPVTGTFSATGSMHAPRTMHTATLLANGAVLIAGGGDYRRPLASAECYDPRSGAFAETGEMHTVRYKHAAIRLFDGTVLVLGGSDGRDWRGLEASAERYDQRRGMFTAIVDMGAPRFKFPGAVALLPDGRVLIAGGALQPEIYDPERQTFVATPDRPDAARYYSTATRLNDGSVLIAGGYDRTLVATNRAWLYRTSITRASPPTR